MKTNIILFTFVALATSFHMYAPEWAVEIAPKITIRAGNNIEAKQGEIAASFQHEGLNATPGLELRGKITELTISDKTSSSTIAASISKQFKKPLSFSEQSLLQKTLDQARTTKNWDPVNKQLEAILNRRPKENTFSERQLFKALESAEKTGSLSDIYNKITSFVGSVKNLISKPAAPENSSGIAITFSDTTRAAITKDQGIQQANKAYNAEKIKPTNKPETPNPNLQKLSVPELENKIQSLKKSKAAAEQTRDARVGKVSKGLGDQAALRRSNGLVTKLTKQLDAAETELKAAQAYQKLSAFDQAAYKADLPQTTRNLYEDQENGFFG